MNTPINDIKRLEIIDIDLPSNHYLCLSEDVTMQLLEQCTVCQSFSIKFSLLVSDILKYCAFSPYFMMVGWI